MSTTRTGGGKTSTETPERQPDPRKALLAANEVTRNADAALTAARERVVGTAEALEEAQKEAVETMASAALDTGDNADSRSRTERARETLDNARSEAEWARLHLHAMEIAHSRAAEAEGKAQRAVTAEEYRTAHREYNDPNSRENVLIDQLTDVVAELITLITERQLLHHRLANEYASFPDDERFGALPGKPITTYGFVGQGVFEVRLPVFEIAEAVKAGVTAAAERQT